MSPDLKERDRDLALWPSPHFLHSLRLLPRGHPRASDKTPLCGWDGEGCLPVQERWCRPGEAQVLVSSSTKLQVSSHSCSGRKSIQERQASPGQWRKLHTVPVTFLESQDCTAGSTARRWRQLQPVPKMSLKQSCCPSCLLWSIMTDSIRKSPASSPTPLPLHSKPSPLTGL